MEYKFLRELRKNEDLRTMLPVDFNPHKVCSFNCVYCPDGLTMRFSIEREEFYPPEDIFKEFEDYVAKNDEPNYAWLTGSGEPTLYSGFKKLAQLIKRSYPNIKIGVCSNGSLLHREDVRNDFSLCDLLIVNLNSIDPKEYLKITRHHKDVKLNNVINAIKLFKQEFKGKLGISTFFIKNINDNERNLQGLKKFLLEIKPDRYLVRIFSGKEFSPFSEESKKRIKKFFNDLPFEVNYIL